MMVEGSEVEDKVDFDEENYSEDIDDDAGEQPDVEIVHVHSCKNTDTDIPCPENLEDVVSQETAMNHIPADESENHETSKHENENEEHAHLLSLPPHGSEVFIGGLPRHVFEEELDSLCEPIGNVHEIKLMVNKEMGECKGYAFVSFKSRESAQKATEELNNKEFKGRTIRCSLPESKYRLFIGNVPKSFTEDDFTPIIREVGPGITNIDLIKDTLNPTRNRGFAFIEYHNNACAEYSRQKMSKPDFTLDGSTPTVSWADPRGTPDHSSSSQVKSVYVKNIPDNTSSEQLKELFECHGEIAKVVLPVSKDFGFVHFVERSSALNAVKDAQKYEINGRSLEVALAKPQGDRRSEGTGPLHHSGFSVNRYGSSGGSNGNFQQPVICGRGPMPAGMSMVPMVLPDGRIGYVLQQQQRSREPLPHNRRSDYGSESRSRRRRSGYDDEDEDGYRRSRRRRPY